MPIKPPKSNSRLFDYEAKHKKDIEAKRSVRFNLQPTVQEKPSRDKAPMNQPVVLDDDAKRKNQEKK